MTQLSLEETGRVGLLTSKLGDRFLLYCGGEMGVHLEVCIPENITWQQHAQMNQGAPFNITFSVV